MKRLLTGLQPSGELTIGNYCGGIKQIIDYQNDFETILFIPDMHSITVRQDPKLIQERIKKHVAIYLACGIDPEKIHIFIQSENLYHANLSWILECHTTMGELNRMTQFKEKSVKQKEVYCGLYTYPVLMAADILLYDAELVPTGVDQQQHVELARNIAERMNNRYKKGLFTLPQCITPKVGAKIKDLQDPIKKMSKSTSVPLASIFLLDDEKTIRKKIMSAVTDSETSIYFDEEKKPGISNLLTVYSAFSSLDIKKVAEKFKNSSYKDLKISLADLLVEKLTEIQKKYNEILNSSKVDEVLDKGRVYSNAIAEKKYREVAHLVGFGRY